MPVLSGSGRACFLNEPMVCKKKRAPQLGGARLNPTVRRIGSGFASADCQRTKQSNQHQTDRRWLGNCHGEILTRCRAEVKL